MMTADALSAYLLAHGIDEDVCQDVIIDFLTWPEPVRYPKSWAFKRAKWRTIDAVRKRRGPVASQRRDGYSDPRENPYTRAEARERLASFVRGADPRWGYWPDYRVMLEG